MLIYSIKKNAIQWASQMPMRAPRQHTNIRIWSADTPNEPLINYLSFFSSLFFYIFGQRSNSHCSQIFLCIKYNERWRRDTMAQTTTSIMRKKKKKKNIDYLQYWCVAHRDCFKATSRTVKCTYR